MNLQNIKKRRSIVPIWLQRALRHGDRPWLFLQILMGFSVLALLVTIGIMLWQQSSASQAKFGLGFFLPTSNPSWDPVNDQFQAWPFIIIANEFAQAVNPLHSQALIEVALLLFGITLLLNGGARFLVWRAAQRNPAGDRP